MRVVSNSSRVASFLVVLAINLASTSVWYLASAQEATPAVPTPPSNSVDASKDSSKESSKEGSDDSGWLVVRDSKGKPVKQISLRKESTVWPLVLDKRRTALVTGTTELKDRDGRYAIPKESVLVSSPGFGSEWFNVLDLGKKPGANSLTLSPAATVTVSVLNAEGRPLSGAKVAATKKDSKWPHSSSGALGAPTSNSLGQVIFDSLSPGEYTFSATDRGSHAHRDTVVKVEPGKSYTVRLRFRD